jgi:hypothetical protein
MNLRKPVALLALISLLLPISSMIAAPLLSSLARAADVSPMESRLFNPDWVDIALLRANTLELLLNHKVAKVIETYPLLPGEYRSNVVVSVHKVEIPPPPSAEVAPLDDSNSDSDDQDAKDLADKQAADAEAKEKDAAENPTGLPYDKNFMTVNSLLDRYKDDLHDDQAIDAKMRKIAEAERAAHPGTTKAGEPEAKPEPVFEYQVQSLQINVLIDETTHKEWTPLIQRDLQAAFSPVFGQKVKVVMERMPFHTPDFQQKALKWFTELQTPLILTLLIAGILAALILYRVLPAAKLPKPVKADEPVVAKVEEPKIEEAPVAAEAPPAPEAVAPVEEGESAEEIRADVRRQKARVLKFVTKNPESARNVIRDWVAQEEMLPSVALFLDTLARNDIQLAKIDIRPEILKAIRNQKSLLSQIDPADVREMYKQIYWALVSNASFGEDLQMTTFAFLETVADGGLLRMLADESPEAQATVLLSLNERRSAKLISKLPREAREGVLSQICAGPKLSKEAHEALMARLQARAKDSDSAAAESLESLVPILSKLNFETQFATARSFLSMDATLRERLTTEYFHVAMLPAASSAFVSKIFVDRPSDWIKSVLSQFDETFRARVIAFLPPMQQRMLDGGDQRVPTAQAMTVLKELNAEILEKIRVGEFSMSEIFEAQGQGQGSGGGMGNVSEMTGEMTDQTLAA